jgi:anti-sigma B factor antagonist
VPPSPEVDVPHALNSLDPIAGHADAASPAFVCSCTDGGLDAAWVHVAGELDLVTAPELERTLHATQQQARLVLLDLRELTFMDRAGVHTIVNASINARKLARRLVLLRGPPNVDRMFTLTGSSDAVEIGDLDHSPAAPSVHALQRSLVSSSLLRTG